jgi:hypothetical protein
MNEIHFMYLGSIYIFLFYILSFIFETINLSYSNHKQERKRKKADEI